MAEDQKEVLEVLRRSLESQGHTVVAANSGDEAADLFTESGPFDLLLTDVVMAGILQGSTLAEHLREIEPELPVVFMSGYASGAAMHSNGPFEDDLWLMKPVARNKLLEAVNRTLGRRLAKK